jgi:hypothetical protein
MTAMNQVNQGFTIRPDRSPSRTALSLLGVKHMPKRSEWEKAKARLEGVK